MADKARTVVNLTGMNADEIVHLIGRTGHVDDAVEIKMRVIAVIFETERVQLKMGWFHNGASYEAWFDSWRVKVS